VRVGADEGTDLGFRLGCGRNCHVEVYPELVKLGHEVHLITVGFGEAPLYEVVEGACPPRAVALSDDFSTGNLNESMGCHGAKLMLEDGPFDVIHAHDWLVDAAIALKHNFNNFHHSCHRIRSP